MQYPPPITFESAGPHRSGPPRARARAGAACVVCRRKKVRCDGRGGKPCSICAFENVECILSPKQPRRNPTKPKTAQHDSAYAASDHHANPNPRSLPQGAYLSSNHSSNEGFSNAVWSKPKHTQSKLHNGPSEVLRAPYSSSPPFPEPARNAAVDPSQSSAELPGFLKPPPASMAQEDLEYLAKKGALTIPDSDLRDACLQSYFQYVQPCFPIFNMKVIQASLNQSGPNPDRMSLLVFQSIIFVGSIWVDIRLIRRLGYLTRHSARKAMHSKVRSLYDSDYEDDRICLVQSLILLTFWWESPNENKDAWHWLGTALSVSRTLGLHQPCAEETLSPEISRFRKRLWWTLLMRDTISSFGLSRAPRIRDQDHFVEMLEMEDFDFHDTVSDMMPGIVSSSPSQQRLLARLCIEMSKLCRILTKILQVAYPESSSGQTASLYSTRQLNGLNRMTLPRKGPDIEQLRLCDNDLSLWRTQVLREVLHGGALPSTPTGSEQAELAHRALLTMLYYTALMTLHRPRILTSSSVKLDSQNQGETSQDESRSLVRYAATEITRIGMDFYEADLVGSLSATCISCLLPAGISHIFDANSSSTLIRDEGLHMLNQCKCLLREFSDAHIAAEWCISILESVSAQVRKQQLAGTDTRDQRDGDLARQSSQTQQGDTPQMGSLYPGTTPNLNRSAGEGPIPNHAINGHSAFQMNDSLAENMGLFPSQTSYRAVDGLGQMPTGGALAVGPAPVPLNEYTTTIALGDMWLDIAGMGNTNIETDWTNMDVFWEN